MKLFFPFLFVFASITIMSCNKNKEPLKDVVPLLLKPTQNGARLSDQELNGMKLYYVVNLTIRREVPDFKRADGGSYQAGVLSSKDVAPLSAVEKSKVFYLTYPSGREDTLMIDYIQLSDKEARKDLCFCIQPLVSITRNRDKIVQTGQNSDGVPIFSFEK